MKVRLEYTAQLRAMVGHAEECLELPDGSNLAEVLHQVAVAHSRDIASYLRTSAGELQPSLLVALNRTVVSPRAAHTVVVNAGDVVTLMPPIAGG